MASQDRDPRTCHPVRYALAASRSCTPAVATLSARVPLCEMEVLAPHPTPHPAPAGIRWTYPGKQPRKPERWRQSPDVAAVNAGRAGALLCLSPVQRPALQKHGCCPCCLCVLAGAQRAPHPPPWPACTWGAEQGPGGSAVQRRGPEVIQGSRGELRAPSVRVCGHLSRHTLSQAPPRPPARVSGLTAKEMLMRWPLSTTQGLP